MRILYSHRIQSRDGQSVHIEELVAAFRKAGHQVLVVGPSFYANTGLGGESRLVAVVRKLLPGWLGELVEFAYNLPAYRRLHRASCTFHPDFIYERYNLFYLAGAWYARRHKLLFYLEVNSPLALERARFGGLRAKRFAQWAERFTWRSGDRIMAVTSVLRETIVAANISPERVHVVHNGIDLERYGNLPNTPQALNQIVLGFVGFVRSWHGLDSVIAAMENADRRIHFLIVGDGPARGALERLATDLGLVNRVRFIGLVPAKDIPSVVVRFDIALQPKANAYASPLKIFEYMAAARAIVAPDQPNIREILADGDTALLFDPDDTGTMWRAVCRLAEDPALRKRLGEAAHREIHEKGYTWSHNARRIIGWAAGDLALGGKISRSLDNRDTPEK